MRAELSRVAVIFEQLVFAENRCIASNVAEKPGGRLIGVRVSDTPDGQLHTLTDKVRVNRWLHSSESSAVGPLNLQSGKVST